MRYSYIKHVICILLLYIGYIESTHRPTEVPTESPSLQHFTQQPTIDLDKTEEPTTKSTPIKITHSPTPSSHTETEEPTFEPTLSPDFAHIITLQPTPDEITLQPTPSNFDPQVFTHEPTIETEAPTQAPTGSTVWAVSDTFILFAIVVLVAVVLVLYLFYFTPEVSKMESMSEGVETPSRNSETTPLVNNNNNNP